MSQIFNYSHFYAKNEKTSYRNKCFNSYYVKSVYKGFTLLAGSVRRKGLILLNSKHATAVVVSSISLLRQTLSASICNATINNSFEHMDF